MNDNFFCQIDKFGLSIRGRDGIVKIDLKKALYWLE